MKKETLEEVAEKYFDYNIFCDGITDFEKDISIRSYIAGAKLQQERMYSEEEVGELVYNLIGEYGKHYGIMIDGVKLNELFEQFKKK